MGKQSFHSGVITPVGEPGSFRSLPPTGDPLAPLGSKGWRAAGWGAPGQPPGSAGCCALLAASQQPQSLRPGKASV